MSGIYIPGMEMPKHCMDCPFMVSRDNDDCILQSDEANKNFENWKQMKAGCPLVPVPEHGRLIDASVLMEKCMKEDTFLAEMLYRKLSNAPTVIPADKEE